MKDQDIERLISAASTPGVHLVLVQHDPWCPGANGDPNNCICNPDAKIVDEGEFTKSMNASMNRKQRREQMRKKGK